MRLGDDEAHVEALLHFCLRLFIAFERDDTDGVNAEVFAVAAIDVDVELGEDRALDDGARGEVAGQGLHVFVGEGFVFGKGDGEFAKRTGFGAAYGDARAFADFMHGEGLRFAETDDEQALGFNASGGMEQQCFGERGFELARRDPGRGCVGDSVGCGEQRGVRFVVLACGDVDGEDCEQRTGEGGGILEEKFCVHRSMVRNAGSCSRTFLMLLRRATDAELPEVVDLINVAFRGSEGWAVEFTVVEGARITVTGLREKLGAKPGMLLLVWRDESEDSLLGSVLLEPVSDGVWNLGLLCVRPNAQTKQLGRTLLAESEEAAKERGGRRIRISVMTIRDTLVSWYERRGYVRTGEMKPFPYDDPSVGKPLRNDLEFAILEKEL